MSLFGVDWDMNGKVDDIDLATDLFFIDEMEREEREANNDDEYDSDFDDDIDESDKYEWRLFCEDGSDYDIDPEDYETEEEYIEALDEAKYCWREDYEIDIDTGIDPEDYETEEEYLEALEDAQHDEEYDEEYDSYDEDEATCRRFVQENADKIIAAKYYSQISGFLYAQAIKDNFKIPCSLPDEDEKREMAFREILAKIAKRDTQLSFEIWDWCIKQFLPYSEYDDNCVDDLCAEVYYHDYTLPDDFTTKMIFYMSKHDNFRKSLIMIDNNPAAHLPELIAKAIMEKLPDTADAIFKEGLEKIKDSWQKVNIFTDGIISWCKEDEGVETVEYFRDKLFPMIKDIQDGMVQDEIEEWENSIVEYINHVKYGWREWYVNDEDYGLNPKDFETESEYEKALSKRRGEILQQEWEERRLAEEAKLKEYEKDKTIYTYCGVLLPFSSRPYSYRTDDDSVKIGDIVIVPVGKEKKEMEGKVVSIGQYSRIAVPFPVESTKYIVRKVEV